MPRNSQGFGFGPALLLAVGSWLLVCPHELAADSGPSRTASVGEAQPISAAERFAAELALEFFEGGAAAWWQHLADDAPLRDLGDSAAAAEISVRLGPSDGASWTLLTPSPDQEGHVALFSIRYSSGLEELIELELVKQADVWRIRHLRSLADPRAIRGSISDQLASTPAPSARWPSPTGRSMDVALSTLGWALLCILATLLWSVIRFPNLRHRQASSATLILLAAIGVSTAGCDRIEIDKLFDRDATPLTQSPQGVESLASLLPLRLALCTDQTGVGDDQSLETLMQRLDLQGPALEAGSAWLAQRLMSLGRLKEAGNILKAQPSPSSLPITELLRARLAWQQSRQKAVFSAYETALNRAPFQDYLRLEAAIAYIANGDDSRAETLFEQLIRSGSRFAAVYYYGSRFATLAERHEQADQLFITGWHLEPISRNGLFSDPLLSHSATRPAVFKLFNFSSVQEPRVEPKNLGKRALQIPMSTDPNFKVVARSLGEHLTLSVEPDSQEASSAGTASKELVIPGGAVLAPVGTQVESAEISEKRREDQALDQLETLIEEASRPGGLTHPARQQLAGIAANALARSNRWDEVLELTQAVSDEPQLAPPALIKLRARALMEQDDEIEAKNLMIGLAKSDLANSRRDPGTYYQLAEMFAKTEDYKLALRLLKKANSLTPYPVNPGRIKQLELDRDLSEQYISRETQHFRLLYPELTGSKYPKHVGWVLEAEWKRLQRWIPTRLEPGHKIEIHLIPVEQFMNAYSRGVSVVGIYDGRVRVPLADLRSLDPFLVGILSHELAHAMIDIRTDGNAPKWLHEGLASHIEMEQPGINPIPDMHKAGRDLTFSIIDPVLAGFSEPQLVELAYSHATWAIHFVESRHGVKGIHRLLDAFRRGDDTESALKRAFRQDVAAFDADWRNWCLNRAPEIWPTQLVHYEQAFDNILDLAGNDGLSQAEIAALTESRGRQSATLDTPPVRGLSLKVRVKSWHETYTAKALPVKKRLKRTMALIQGKQQGDLAAECRGLEGALRGLIRDPAALQAPTPKTTASLKKGYGLFLDLAQACGAGDLARAKAQINPALKALGGAKKDLKRFGVAP